MSTKYSLSVTLTNLHDPSDKRSLTLFSGEPAFIGRSSKVEAKGLQPSPTNALFDCPVVSRVHAELNFSSWASVDDQVTIKDKGSMHGTHVNGKAIGKNQTMSLRSGDRIRFGANVTRGVGLSTLFHHSFFPDWETDTHRVDSHDGIVVTFQKILPVKDPSSTAASLTATTTGGYRCPDYDSNDEDEDDDDDGALSFMSDADGSHNEHGTSSALTTPEQIKTRLGSAARPIVLDNIYPLPCPTVICLDDEEEYVPPSPSAPRLKTAWQPKESSSTAKPSDSQTKASLNLVPELINSYSDWSPVSPVLPTTPADNRSLSKTYNPTQPTSGDAVTDAAPSLNENENVPLPTDNVNDIARAVLGPEHGVEDAEIEFPYDYSEDDASDSYDIDDIPFEDEEPHSYSIQRQISPELEAPPVSQIYQPPPLPSLGQYGYTPCGYVPLSAPQRAFDPVRASQMTTYTSGPSQSSHTIAPVPLSAHPNPLQNAIPWPISFIDERPRPQPHGIALSAPQQISSADFPGYKHGSFISPDDPFRDYMTSKATAPELSSFGAESNRSNQSQTSRIAIPKLVEPTSAPQKGTPASDINPPGPSEGVEKPGIDSVAETSIGAGKKRKADAISSDTDPSVVMRESQSEALLEATEVLSKTIDKVHRDQHVPALLPARKKLKVRRQPMITGDVMKYAVAAAAVGGAATIAFLLSPVADFIAPGTL